MLAVELRTERCFALPQRALWHPGSASLFVADLHLGKSSAFRVAGIPVPDTTAHTLARLSACLDETRAERLVILGDLLHAPTGRTPIVMDTVAAWRRARPRLDVLLVLGNHDDRSGPPPSSWDFQVVGGPVPDSRSPFVLAHTPEELAGAAFGLCGHLHPAFSLDALASLHRRAAPCLWVTPNHVVLPAFGDFTGGARIRPSRSDRVLLFADGEVIDLPTIATR